MVVIVGQGTNEPGAGGERYESKAMPTALLYGITQLLQRLKDLLVGLVAGAIARFLVPGPDPMGWLGTLILGIIGSFVGGTLAALIFGGTLTLSPAGLLGSIIGAIIVLLIWRAMGGERRVAT